MNIDGTYNVIFEDRSLDEHVKRELLRLPDVFWKHQTIEVLTKKCWYLATIRDHKRDGTYDLEYSGEGNVERGVHRSRLRHARDIVSARLLACAFVVLTAIHRWISSYLCRPMGSRYLLDTVVREDGTLSHRHTFCTSCPVWSVHRLSRFCPCQVPRHYLWVHGGGRRRWQQN